jgi:capsular polysaccharide biosynthesis protein
VKGDNLNRNKEISLFDYFAIFNKYKRLILLIVITSVFLALLYNQFTPKKYFAKGTFFLPLEVNSSASSVVGYARFLGASLPSDLDDYVKFLIESKRIKSYVIKDFYPYFFPGSSSIKKENLIFIGSKLDLGVVKLTQDKTGVFEIFYENEDPVIAYEVVMKYIDNIMVLNKELEITAQKKIISVLDSPVIAEASYKPKKLINIIIAFMGSLVFSVFFVLLLDYFLVGLKRDE